MATKWISPTWRMPDEQNQSKFNNYSLSFDGAAREDIQLGTTTFLLPGQPSSTSTSISNPKFSASIFFNFNSSVAGTTSYMIGAGQAGGATYWDLKKDSNDNLQANFRITIGAYATITGGTTLSHSTWYHACVTWDGDNINLYLNGVSDATQVAATTFYYGSTISHPTIGSFRYSASAAINEWEGKLSQATVFDYALSQSQINYLYNSCTPQNPMAISGNAPIAYYPLGGSSTGSASTLTTPNESVPSATVFDFVSGSNQYIDSGSASYLNGLSAFSFSSWVNISTFGSGDVISSDWSYSTTASLNKGHYTISQGPNNGSAAKINIYIKNAGADGGNSVIETSDFILNNNKWHHVLFTYNSGNILVYVDNVPYSFTTIGTIPTLLTSEESNLNIGRWQNVGRYWDGKLSNIQLWSSKLEASEVTTLYNNGSPLSGTQPQAANLKAWYKLDNTDFYDTFNNTNKWMINNNLSTSFNKCFWMNPLGIQVPQTLGYQDGTTAFSGAAWVNISSGNMFIMSRQRGRISSTGAYPGWGFRTVGSGGAQGDPQFQIETNGDGNVIVKSLSHTLQDGFWHFVAFTYDGSQDASGVKLYVDGYEDTNRQVLSNNITGTIPNYSTPFMVGGSYRNNSNSRGGTTQFMSNAMYFESELSAADILTIYNNGIPLNDLASFTNLKGWWKLDDTATYSTEWTIPDASGNGNTGTSDTTMPVSNRVDLLPISSNGISSGMTTANLVNSDLTRSIPYSSYSISFDGTSEFVETSSTVDATGNKSFSFWLKRNSSTTNDGAVMTFVNTGKTDDYMAIGLFGGSAAAGALLNAVTDNAGSTVKTSSSAIATDVWYHFVVIKSATAITAMYINGVPETLAAGGFYYSTATAPQSYLVRADFSGSNYYAEINLSNVAVFNGVLTQDQVLTIYNGGVPNDISSLSPVGWWSLAGDSYYNGTDFICPDLSSNSNNGTSSGMGGTELVGNGPGSTANGIATSMNIPENLQGNAPNSTKNAFSVNMTETDRETNVPS